MAEVSNAASELVVSGYFIKPLLDQSSIQDLTLAKAAL